VKSHKRDERGVERDHELLNEPVVDEACNAAVDVAHTVEHVAAELLRDDVTHLLLGTVEARHTCTQLFTQLHNRNNAPVVRTAVMYWQGSVLCISFSPLTPECLRGRSLSLHCNAQHTP